MNRNCAVLAPDEATLSVVHRTLKIIRNSQSDPLWSQSQGTLARLQKQNTNKMSYPLEKNKEAVNLLRVVSSPEEYVFFFNFNSGLFSNLLSFRYCFYLPYVLDLSRCVKAAESFSQKGMRAIAVLRNSNTKYVNLIFHKLVWTLHKSKMASRKLFPYIPVLNLQFSSSLTECVKCKYRMKFIDDLETLCDKSQHMMSLHLPKGDGGRDVSVVYLHQVDLHDNNWRKTVRQRQIGYKAYKGSSREPSRINLKKILKAMKKRMIRTTPKLTLRNLPKREQITCVIKVNTTSGYISKHF